jgi:hypothetical protein
MKMNRLNPFLFLLAFMFSFVFIACGSDDDDNNEDPVDNENPVISITSPADGASYNRGAVDAFAVSGELTDNVALDSCSFSLSTDLKSASSLKSIDDPQVWQPDAKGFSISGVSHSFSGEAVFGSIPDDAMAGSYTLNVEVIDGSGNSATESIAFTITAE